MTLFIHISIPQAGPIQHDVDGTRGEMEPGKGCFNIVKDILLQDGAKSGIREIGCKKAHIALQFDRRLDRKATTTPANCQSYSITLNVKLMGAILCEILRNHVLCHTFKQPSCWIDCTWVMCVFELPIDGYQQTQQNLVANDIIHCISID